jgi:hypothetical protein
MDTPTPTAGKVATIGAVNLLTTALKLAAGALVTHGWLAAGNTEIFIGIGMAVATYLWSFWTDYGSVIAKAALDILRAKVLNAAAQAQRTPTAAPAALAALDTHVTVTTPLTGPAGPVEQAVADKGRNVISSPPPITTILPVIMAVLALG